MLTVEDAGPGMSEADLGWSLVKRIADEFGAQVTVGCANRLGGLAVRVSWSEQA